MKVTQKEIAQRLGLHPATISKVLNREPDDYTSIETKQKVFNLAVQLGYEFSELKSAQTREHTRKPIDLPVQIIIVMVGAATNETVWDRGQARIRDISPSGALLADVQLTKDVLPLRPFRLKLVAPPEADLPQAQGSNKKTASEEQGFEISCKVVRLDSEASEGQTTLGLKFETIPEGTRNRLYELCLPAEALAKAGSN
jgi:transcriptional regulator with XRE-family HTH domain